MSGFLPRQRWPFVVVLLLLAAKASAQNGDELLRGFSAFEQSSMRRACHLAGLSGPADYYACLKSQAAELRRSPGEPSLTEFSSFEQSSMRRACYVAGLSGPADWYACLRAQAIELRRAKRELGLESPGRVTTTSTVAPLPPDGEPPPRGGLYASFQLRSRSLDVPPASAIGIRDRNSAGPAVTKTPLPRTTKKADTAKTSSAPSQAEPARAGSQLSVDEYYATAASPRSSDDGTVWVLAFWGGMLALWLYRCRSAAHGGTARRRTRRRMVFADQQVARRVASPAPSDLRDGVTGQPLRSTAGLFRCARCKVFYGRESVAFLRVENGGRCMACGSSSIPPAPEPRA